MCIYLCTISGMKILLQKARDEIKELENHKNFIVNNSGDLLDPKSIKETSGYGC